MNHCYHCHQSIPEKTHYHVMIDGRSELMCCPGCQAVSQMIIDHGLTDYYRFRDQPAQSQVDLIPKELNELKVFDKKEVQDEFLEASSKADIKQTTLLIEGITCAACIWLLERHIGGLTGVTSFTVNMSTHQAELHWQNEQIPLSMILRGITNIGYTAHPYRQDTQEKLQKDEYHRALRRLSVAGLGMMQVVSFAFALYLGDHYGMQAQYQLYLRWISFIITTPILFYAGQSFFIYAWRGMRMRHLGMDMPIALALGGAYIASAYATFMKTGDVYFDSICMLIFFILIARFIELRVRMKNGRFLNSLQKLLPMSTLRFDEHDQLQSILIKQLQPGDKVLVKPGETIPCDGYVVSGQSSVNEALLTGEPIPKRKMKDEKLIAGSQNIESPLTMIVTRTGEETRLSAIMRLYRKAQFEKPKTVSLANQIAGWFVTGVIVIAVITGITWYYYDESRAFWVMLSVLIVSCPCALSLATPTALAAATNQLARLGFLITRGHVLEGLAKVKRIIFDKTGTLTTGQFELLDVHLISNQDRESALAIASALEQASEHPIARAFINYSRAHTMKIPSIKQLYAAIGKGMEGEIEGERYRIGDPNYVASLFKARSIEVTAPTDSERWVLLGNTSGPIAWFHINDTLRDSAKEAIAKLKKLNIDMHILSGDTSRSVATFANTLNLSTAIDSATPQSKLAYLQSLKSKGEATIMVGDGINDVPVLAASQVSIAMGSGTDFTKSCADAILLNDQLTLLPQAIQCAKKTNRIIKQNFIWALGYNVIAIPLAASGFIPPYVAAIGMSMSSLIVVLNTLRIYRHARHNRHSRESGNLGWIPAFAGMTAVFFTKTGGTSNKGSKP